MKKKWVTKIETTVGELAVTGNQPVRLRAILKLAHMVNARIEAKIGWRKFVSTGVSLSGKYKVWMESGRVCRTQPATKVTITVYWPFGGKQ